MAAPREGLILEEAANLNQALVLQCSLVILQDNCYKSFMTHTVWYTLNYCYKSSMTLVNPPPKYLPGLPQVPEPHPGHPPGHSRHPRHPGRLPGAQGKGRSKKKMVLTKSKCFGALFPKYLVK